jgi:hypothetical protein
MTVAAILDACARRGVTLIAEGDALRARGPKSALDELRPAIRVLKPELVKTLSRELDSASPPTSSAILVVHRSPKPYPDGPGHEWHQDCFGRWVNLFGLRAEGGPQ